MKFFHSLLFLFLLMTANVACGQVPELVKNPAFREDAQAAVDSLYNFNVVASEKILARWKQQYPNHPLWKLFDGMTYWWMILSDLKNQSYDEHFLRLMKEADYAASKLLHEYPGHVDALIIKAVANGYISRHFANRGDWLTSLQYARTALKAYKYLQNAMPNLPDLKLAEGLKLYYMDYLPEAYPVVKTVAWLLPDGNKEKGIQLLKEASKNAIFADAEATYFLGNINLNYEHNFDKAVHYFRKLYKSFPRNNYYSRLLVKNYYKLDRYKKAMQTINETLRRWNKQNLPFGKILKSELYYWKGKILMRRNKTAKASEFFIKSFELGKKLTRTNHRYYYAAAGYYAGETLTKLGKKKEATSYYKAVLHSKVGENYKELIRGNHSF